MSALPAYGAHWLSWNRPHWHTDVLSPGVEPMIDSPLTFFALAVPPLVTVIFIAFCWLKRNPVSRPSIVSAVPFALTSIPILLAHSAAILLRIFAEMSTHGTASAWAIVSGLLRVQRPITLAFLEFVACMTAIFLVSAILRFSRGSDRPLIHAYVSHPALFANVFVLVALFLLVYFQYSTADLVMKVVDYHRYNELASQYGAVRPAYYAAQISSRLVAVFFLSQAEFLALIVVGVLNLVWRQKQSSRQVFAKVIALGASVMCGVCALIEMFFVSYLVGRSWL